MKKTGPGKKAKTAKRGELNYAPDHIEGEDTDSHEKQKEIMQKEIKKLRPDNSLLNQSMEATFSYRRQFIKDSPKFLDIKEAYPALFTVDGQLDEFQRLTNIDIKATFAKELLKIGRTIYRVAENKTGKNKTAKANQIEKIITEMKEENQDVTSEKEMYNTAIAGMLLLPLLLNESPEDLIIYGKDQAAIDNIVGKSTFPMLVCEGSPHSSSLIYIVGETEVLVEAEEFLTASAALFSMYYTCDVEYPKALDSTYKFIQNTILKLPGGKIPAKIISLSDVLLKQ